MLRNRNVLSMRSGSYYMHDSMFGPGEFYPEHCHDFHEFFLVDEGVLEHTLNGKVSILPAGTVQLILPGDSHIVACAPGCSGVRIRNCNVSSEEMLKVFAFLSAGSDFLLDDCVQTVRMPPDHHWRHLQDLAREICAMSDGGTSRKNSLLRLLTQEVLAVLMRRSFQEKAVPPQWLAESFTEMKKKNNYTAGLSRFVALSGRTKEHLCRSMKKFYGISPQTYVISLRLEEAADRLLHGSCGISEIAYDAGFRNLSYFRRCFLRKYGMTPLKYRSRFRILRH